MMDRFFDGDFLRYLVPLILLILFSLPDALRRKRKYPKRKYPRRTEKTLPGGRAQEPVPDEGTAAAEPETVPDLPEPTGLQRRWQQAAELPEETREQPLKPPAVAVQKKPESWSGLSQPARDIYAGIVWSELLQPPLARRRKK